MENLVDQLIVNAKPSQPWPPEIDVIFDIGALNGGYGAGVALYLRRLELLQRVRVRRISGCSIGAFLAAWFCAGGQETLLHYAEDMFQLYKENASFQAYEELMPKFVNAAFTSDEAVRALKGKLYINYYDTRQHCHKTVSKFRHRQHLCECILRSSHIPYILNGQARRRHRYIDGIVPYFFPDHPRPCLFINMMLWHNFWRTFVTRDEVTIYERIMQGVHAAHRFVYTMEGHPLLSMCSWTHEWAWWFKLYLRLRLLGCLTTLYLVEWVLLMGKYSAPKPWLSSMKVYLLNWVQQNLITK